MFRGRLTHTNVARASRRLAHKSNRRSSPLPAAVPAIDRAQTAAVLDTLQIDVVTRLRAEHTNTHVSNLEARLKISRFLEAVFGGDYSVAMEGLEGMRRLCTGTSMSERPATIYATCFVTLLAQVCRADRPRLPLGQIMALVRMALDVPPPVKNAAGGRLLREVHVLILLALMRVLAATPAQNRITCVNLVAYIRDLQNQLDVSLDVLLDRVRKQYGELLPQYNQVTRQNLPALNLADEDYVTLTNALETAKQGKHLVSFTSLCEFIELTSFDASRYHNSTIHTKYYEIADSLPGKKRAEFMDAYLRFNYKKQLLVEDAAQAVYKSVSGAHSMMAFTALHRQWIRSWLDAATASISGLLTTRGPLEKFGFVFSVLTPENVVALCLTHLLSATVPNQYARVLTLASSSGHALRKELSRAHPREFPLKTIPVLLNTDHAIELVCSIIKILLDKCKLPKLAELGLNHAQADSSWSNNAFRFCHIKNEESGSKYMRYGAIEAHPIVAENFHVYRELFMTGSYRLPMLHPPKPWTSPRNGGFLATPLALVKSSEPKAADVYLEKAHSTGQLDSVYLSVNSLGACPWTINLFTLDVFNRLIKSPHSPGLPAALTAHIPASPPKPGRNNYPSDEAFNSALSSWKHAQAERSKMCQEVANLRIYYDMVNRLANSFARNGEILYLPHNMDFRGRVYPSVSFLSHQSEDLVRSLLMFWEAKPLGTDGYNWLVYHLANLFHKTKVSMEQLHEFVRHNKSAIIASAKEPNAPGLWWLSADNPWQVLALCKEFDAIWSFSGDVQSYKTRIPVHQDGSCNGLQHYSALGADTEAARAVNVLPDEEIQDVYTTVLDLVKERVSKDQEVSHELADMAQKLLSRKLIKQTVMTTVYGVTPFGAMQQVRRRIDELIPSSEATIIPERTKLNLASYISQNVLDSISDLFAGAKRIQNWLVDNCTRCIQAYDVKDFPADGEIDFFSGKHFRPMMWTSLSGFPVIQMYRKRAIRELQTPLQKLILNDDTRLAPIDELKLKNGIAPNFIHSIDAIHLLMTCLGAKAENITFASVHDSFWTHPSEVDTLSKIIRKEFARLHSSDIIENLRCDLEYVNRNSLQLVWADISIDGTFVAGLKKVRGEYSQRLQKMPIEKQINTCLEIEVRDNKSVAALVEQFKPTLLWKSLGSAPPVIYNSATVPTIVNTKISTRTHVPLLVPVKIPDAPEVGTLDIQSVLHSKYFFS